MSPARHTPEPWEIDGDRGVIFGTAPADNGELPICQLLHDHTDNLDADRGAADARLIKAALPMLKALEALVCEASCDIEATDEERDDFNAAVDAAMAAISLAKDPQPGHKADVVTTSEAAVSPPTAKAAVKLAIISGSLIQAATAQPLVRGWWRIDSRSWNCEVQAFDPRELPAKVEEKLLGLGVHRVYGPRAKATRLAHAEAAK
jgi:hypothetical protein